MTILILRVLIWEVRKENQNPREALLQMGLCHHDLVRVLSNQYNSSIHTKKYCWMSYSSASLYLAIFCNQLFCQKKLELFKKFNIFGKLEYELPKRIFILKKSDEFFLDFFLKSFGWFPMTSTPERVKYSFLGLLHVY